MVALTGFFDGTTCIPLEKADMKPNQKLIITVLDDYIEETEHTQKKNKFNDLFNSWQGTESADDLLQTIYNSRISNNKEIQL